MSNRKFISIAAVAVIVVALTGCSVEMKRVESETGYTYECVTYFTHIDCNWDSPIGQDADKVKEYLEQNKQDINDNNLPPVDQ